jgi:hypothetical protein
MGIEMRTEEQELTTAREHLVYWQRELRLDHMDFEVLLENVEEFKGRLATCRVSPKRHRQKIILRHPSERTRQDAAVFRRDLEVCVVHELLHTKEMLWRDHPKVDKVMDTDEWLKELHEDSLDAVAEALVRARRGLRR